MLAVLTAAAGGLAAGWLLRAVVFRHAVPAGDPPRSACPECAVPLRRAWRLPVRCPACGSGFWPRPGLAETGTAALAAGIALRVHPWPLLAAAWWLAACGVPLALIDVRVRRLPGVLTAPAWAGAFAVFLAAAAAGGQWGTLARAAAGCACAAGVFALMRLLPRRYAPGPGDVKLAASLGLVLGWAGWLQLSRGLIAGPLLDGVWGTVLLAARPGRRDWGMRLPLGPFLLAGSFLALILPA